MGLITNLLLAPIVGPFLPFILLAKLFLSLAFLPVFLLLLPVLIPWWIAKVSACVEARHGRGPAAIGCFRSCSRVSDCIVKHLKTWTCLSGRRIWEGQRPRRAAKGSEALATHCVTRVDGAAGSR